MHSDHRSYFHYTGRSRLDKSINSLLGIIEGIAIDGEINATELEYLDLWLREHRDVERIHPFNELIPVVESALADRRLTDDERQDIAWLCERLRSTEYYNATTADLQRLHAIVGGITADAIVSPDELLQLRAWLSDHEHLRTIWPYDEIDSLVTSVMADKKIDADEHKALMAFFSEFVALLDDRTITNPVATRGTTIAGVCAVCPEIEFDGSVFCFTGASNVYPRSRFNELVQELGGQAASSVSKKVHYLVIGADGNPCWAYACYGRKVEKAVLLRREGVPIVIVHENDFHDAVADSQ